MKTVVKMGGFGVIGCAMLAGQCAWADEPVSDTTWANSAWYVGAGAGRSKAKIDEERLTRSLIEGGASSVKFSTNERDTGYKVFLGKQLNEHFALEGGYFDLGRFGFDATTMPLGALSGNVRLRGINLDVLGQLPLSTCWSAYARLGMNYTKADTHFSGDRLYAVTNPNPSTRKLNPTLGMGLEYKLSDTLAVRGEVSRYRVNDAVGNRGDVDFFSLNLVYKMGKPATRATPAYVEPAPVVEAPAPAAPVVQPPPAPAPVPVSEKVSFSAEALFDFDKSVVKPEGKAGLDALMGKLQGMNTEVIVTVGYADSVGTNAYNQKLSERRAEAVKAYFIEHGLETGRVYTEGKGETMPVADNKSAAGRAKNRRVTVEFVGTRSVAK